MSEVFCLFDDEGGFIAPFASLAAAQAHVKALEDARNTHIMMLDDTGRNPQGLQQYPYDPDGWDASGMSYLGTYFIRAETVRG